MPADEPTPPAQDPDSANESMSGLVPRMAATPAGRRKLAWEYAAATVVVLRRLTTWVGVLSLVLASYAWWGSEGSPLRGLLNVALASVPAWLMLLVVERKLFRVAEDSGEPKGDA